jgi:hypothetical protein
VAGGDGGSATSANGRKQGAQEGLDASGVVTHGTDRHREAAGGDAAESGSGG